MESKIAAALGLEHQPVAILLTARPPDDVTIPWAAGCQTIGILPWAEARAPAPRAVVGLTDISARKYVRSQLGAHCLTFAMPWTLFLEMEAAVAGSFLERPTWRSLRGTGAERT